MTRTDTPPPTPAADREPRRGGLDLFRVFGIRIRLDWSWFLIFLLLLWSLSAGYLPTVQPGESPGFYWLMGLGAVVLFFGSLLLHELAHALVARAHGMEIPAITLFLFGGVSELRDEPRKPSWEFRIAVVGPLTSFALVGVFWGIHALLPESTNAVLMTVLHYLGWVNLALGVFNLLPGYPLDGGRLLRAFLWKRSGSLGRATRRAADVGKALAVGIIVLGGIEIFLGGLLGGLWLVLIGLFLRSSAEGGYQMLAMRRALDCCAVEAVMTRDPVTVRSDTTLRELVDSYILERGYRGFPVVDDGEPRGLITLSDVKAVPKEHWDEITVGERMHSLSSGVTVDHDAPLTDALERMQRSGTGRLLVMSDGKAEGMLSREGLLRFVQIRNVLDADEERAAS